MKNVKNKRILLVIVGVFLLAGIGLTYAISRDDSSLANTFAIADYEVAYSEDFIGPANWQPCEEVSKLFTVTNNGGAPVTVRLSYEEYWRNATDTANLPSTKDGIQLAQIIFQNENDWTLKSNGYYYYNNTLAAGATTSSLFKAVKLNCNANFDKDNVCTKTANGTICEKPADEYEGAKYHLKITAETMQANAEYDMGSLYGEIAKRANPEYQIDFTRKATISNDVSIANGNGVNAYTENGQKVYYFRGKISDNNVIWSNLCWKIVRTTAAGGVKMIYNGAPSNGQCNATGQYTAINNTAYQYDTNWLSPANIGYKHGAVINLATLTPGSNTYVFANDVTRNGNTYTLSEDAISGTWADKRLESATRYHYFCTNGSATCSNTQIAYITNYSYGSTIYYLPLNGYNDIEAAKDAMFTNTTDSNAKRVIEAWFESKNLDDNALEDAVFCNDRSFWSGSIKGKDSPGRGSDSSIYGFFAAYGRNVFVNDAGNVEPSLDCLSSRDAFQVSNNIAKLKHKIGLPTIDEMTLAGMPWFERQTDNENYLATGRYAWLGSPSYVGEDYSDQLRWNDAVHTYYTGDAEDLRPMVVLKRGTLFVSGTGLKTDPYIVE